MHALHYANELLVRVRLAFQKLLQTRQTNRNYQKQVLVMMKHCLGDSHINSIPAWSKEFFSPNFSLQNNRKSLRVQLERADIIHSHSEIKEIFDPENSPFH